jgi:hypothetical protein
MLKYLLILSCLFSLLEVHDVELNGSVNGDEDSDVSDSSPEKPELPDSVNAWRMKNLKKPARKKNKNKRKEFSPPHKDFATPNPFDLSKRVRGED